MSMQCKRKISPWGSSMCRTLKDDVKLVNEGKAQACLPPYKENFVV